jgi:hypothetical protein
VVDTGSLSRLHSIYPPNMSYARSRSARLVSSNEISSASVHFTDFYREEFIRHRQCLEAQREYFSEQAIKGADRALALVLGQLDRICAQEDADAVMAALLRQFNAVTGLSTWSDPSQRH